MCTSSEGRRAGLVLAGAALLACAAPAPAANAGSEPVRVTWYHAGRAYPAPEADAAGVESALRALLAADGDVLRVFVTDGHVASLRAGETGVEIVYPAAAEFPTRLRGPVRADRFFILFSPGAAGDTRVYHGDGRYELPPLVYEERAAAGPPLRARLRQVLEGA